MIEILSSVRSRLQLAFLRRARKGTSCRNLVGDNPASLDTSMLTSPVRKSTENGRRSCAFSVSAHGLEPPLTGSTPEAKVSTCSHPVRKHTGEKIEMGKLASFRTGFAIAFLAVVLGCHWPAPQYAPYYPAYPVYPSGGASCSGAPVPLPYYVPGAPPTWSPRPSVEPPHAAPLKPTPEATQPNQPSGQ